MLAGLVAALTAWDMAAFLRGLHGVDRVVDRRALERQHLLRLLLVDSLSLLLGALALGLQVSFGFGLVVLLGLAMILALSGVVRFVRRESN
jgi:hypothetical protein